MPSGLAGVVTFPVTDAVALSDGPVDEHILGAGLPEGTVRDGASRSRSVVTLCTYAWAVPSLIRNPAASLARVVYSRMYTNATTARWESRSPQSHWERPSVWVREGGGRAAR